VFNYQKGFGECMNNKTVEITKYLRSTVAARVNKSIEFKDKSFFNITFSGMISGNIDASVFCELAKDINTNKDLDFIEVIIVGKTIRMLFDAQEKVSSDFDDLSGIYYIPAKLSKEGLLYYNSNKLPWIPRIYLHPMIEEKLCVGNKDAYDNFLSDNISRVHKIEKWHDYISFAIDFYEHITGTNFSSNVINNTELENNIYIILDDTVDTIRGILELYDDILRVDDEKELYNNFIKLDTIKSIPLVNNSLENMETHLGQMGGEYPLSTSQRECINHFNKMSDGDILAVNGPPGTGKTTLLQSIVSNLYVKHAIEQKKPPLIVATSTNNQAVTNIIESFGKIKIQGLGNLEERWINNVDSFAVYFPSKSKEGEADKKGYQYTNQRGEHFISYVESKDNILASKNKMLTSCNEYFRKKLMNIDQCKSLLHERLLKVNLLRIEILKIASKIDKLNLNGISIESYLKSIEFDMSMLKKEKNMKAKRVEEWLTHFKSLPILYKIFRFIKFIKRKIRAKNRIFMNLEEFKYIKESMTYEEIEEAYSLIIKQILVKYNTLEELFNNVKEMYEQYNEYDMGLRVFNIDMRDKMDIALTSDRTLDKMNELIDTTLRYIEFWLAVHYYECRWLAGEEQLTEEQKGKNYKNILEQLFVRLSMITPCYVMTFYKLPYEFKYYIKDKGNSFLYNKIDLLIVDEAGQVSPEVAACSFSLAKKAIVVGDVHQVEPVWSVNSALDTALAIENNVISNVCDFKQLECCGINASESSVMKVASKRCKYGKYEDGGLFLCEHRRCYNEIINYCNELVYKSRLEPMRGIGALDKAYLLKDIPHMGYMQIDTMNSQQRGTSRYNINEVRAIAEWINNNYNQIRSAYLNEDEKNLIGIITPFKAQENLMRKEFSKLIHNDIRKNISFGTIHTFQGAERRIIIMSTVYGSLDGCYFINMNKSLLNVAVSRAKDSFLVFGDINCLDKTVDSPSGLLRKFAEENPINSEVK